ncbi:hypothetical protein RJ55_08379 [Drechmeria coniospora]|nr:hypothetical protein RJ55_08379 [Drechmeria coniospora]
MDILKVLSRGTKRSGSKSGQFGGKVPVSLPSAGTKTNPQLFHDEVRGQKRKRFSEESRPETNADADAELPMVDFFAPKSESAAGNKTSTRETERGMSPAPSPAPAKKMSEDECRQLLRSHRLKITLLSKAERQKKVKKAKKKKAAVEAKEKKEQLFPQPLESFVELCDTFGVSRRVSENLLQQGYRVPTEVQLGSLPLLLRPDMALPGEEAFESGVDFLAVAPTGSGKTISFLIPAVNDIMRRRAEGAVRGVHELEAVIVAPTRELAYQIANEGRKLVQGTGIRVVGMRKGMRLAAAAQYATSEAEASPKDEVDDEDAADEKYGADEDGNGNGNGNGDKDEDEDEDEEEEEEEEEGEEVDAKAQKGGKGAAKKQKTLTKADILVTTPLLLLNLLSPGPSGTAQVLPSVRRLILDEADVLLDPLFREQTMGIWTACTNADMTVSCWSATMGSNIESIVGEAIQSRAATLATTPKPLVRLVVGLKDTAVPNVVHKLTYTASEQGKLLALRQLLHPTASDDGGPPLRPPFLVFTQTIERAMALHEELKYDIPLEAGGSARIAALHSSLPDPVRAAIMRRFRAGEIWILITTDVLARGVDFAGVNGVVNYDVPGSSAVYVHRVGRTGRAGREGGVAVTFYTKEDIPFVKTVANVIAVSEKQAGKCGDDAGVQKWLLDALPKVSKNDRKTLKEKGIEARRSGAGSKITSQSGYERRKENNRRAAIEGHKKRRPTEHDDDDEEWAGLGE